MDYNNNNENYYEEAYNNTYESVALEKNTIGMIGMILGIVGFFLNPVYLVSVAAIILSIIGLTKKNTTKGMAIAGIILGPLSLIAQLVFDFVFTALTYGVGVFSFFC